MRTRCHEQAVPLSVSWLTHTYTRTQQSVTQATSLQQKNICKFHTLCVFFLIYKHVELTENNI